MKEMNKRGVFFTIMVIVILSLFLVSYTFFSGAQQRKTVEKRIETMNSFLFSVEEDLSRQLFISSFRIIFLFNKRIVETGSYLDDVNESFQEAFYNGTINNYTDSEIQILMAGSTFSDIIDNINQKANKINVNVTFVNPRIELIQSDPWHVQATLTGELAMEDLTGLAAWNRTQTVISQIPIEGFENPVFFLNTGGSVSSTIVRTPYVEINSSVLLDHATNSYYDSSTTAPTFLNRLEGNLTGQHEYGVEALVHTPSLPSVKPDVPIMDYVYFQSNPPANGLEAAGMPSWLLLDSAHCTTYGLICS